MGATFRVATWNLFFRALEARLDLVAEILSEVNADVVLLQEAREEHCSRLASVLGYHTMLIAPHGERDHSPAILSRYHAEVRDVLALPFFGSNPQHLVTMHAPTAIGRAIFATTHLQHSDRPARLALDDCYRRVTNFYATDARAAHSVGGETLERSIIQRLEQLKAIQEALQEASSSTPLVFAGDFNCLPDSVEYKSIRAWGLRDAWRSGPRIGGRETILENNALVAERPSEYLTGLRDQHPGGAGPQDFTLDFQFYNSALRATEAWRFGHPKKGERWASDHLGVAVDYTATTDGAGPL